MVRAWNACWKRPPGALRFGLDRRFTRDFFHGLANFSVGVNFPT